MLKIVSKLWQQSLCHISGGERLERQERLKFRENFPAKLNAMHFLKQEWSIKEEYDWKGSKTVITLIPQLRK